MFFGVSEPITHFSSALSANAGQVTSYAPLGGPPGAGLRERDDFQTVTPLTTLRLAEIYTETGGCLMSCRAIPVSVRH